MWYRHKTYKNGLIHISEENDGWVVRHYFKRDLCPVPQWCNIDKQWYATLNDALEQIDSRYELSEIQDYKVHLY